jgi:hypothetical protein
MTNHCYRPELPQNALIDDRRTVIPVRREAAIFAGWGIKV